MEMRGLVASIQRMSIHDGPGIRSTIFMKGCNLRCVWCHNPEMFSTQRELEWISDKCIDCGACLQECKTQALYIDETGKVAFNKSKCDSCFKCVSVCYPQALNIIGTEYSPERLYQEIEQDLPFFNESGGGITFSGGEPMLQWQFVKEALKLFKANGVHTAIETNLTASWDKYKQVLPYTDLIMGDVKLINNEQHKYWTKGSNKRIIENIRKLDLTGNPYYLRTPIIPGINDSEEEMNEIADFLAGLKNLERYELLPFHPLGDYKYKNLGIVNPLKKVKGITKEDLSEFKPVLKKHGINYY